MVHRSFRLRRYGQNSRSHAIGALRSIKHRIVQHTYHLSMHVFVASRLRNAAKHGRRRTISCCILLYTVLCWFVWGQGTVPVHSETDWKQQWHGYRRNISSSSYLLHSARREDGSCSWNTQVQYSVHSATQQSRTPSRMFSLRS